MLPVTTGEYNNKNKGKQPPLSLSKSHASTNGFLGWSIQLKWQVEVTALHG
jgi:hypothetical protein